MLECPAFSGRGPSEGVLLSRGLPSGIDGDLVMTAEKIPELMNKGMDQAARDRAKAYKVHGFRCQLT